MKSAAVMRQAVFVVGKLTTRREGWASAAKPLGVAMRTSSAGRENVRQARILSSCCGGIAAATTSRLAPERSEVGAVSETGFVVAIVAQGKRPAATSYFCQSQTGLNQAGTIRIGYLQSVWGAIRDDYLVHKATRKGP